VKTEKLLDLFARNGIKVIFRPLRYSSGGLLQHGGNWYCLVSSTDSFVRQRWTLAHELGHYLLHARSGVCSLFDEPTQEREANKYAAELLIPVDQVIACWEALNIYPYNKEEKIKILAKEFEVSAQAMEIRIKEVNNVPSSHLVNCICHNLCLDRAGYRAR